MDDKRLTTALVAVPVLHVLSTSIYLWAFATGFGGNLYAFVAPSDLFATSIADMVRVYLTSLLIPFLMGINRYLPGYEAPTLPFGDGASHKTSQKVIWIVTAFLLVMVVAVEALVLYEGRSFNFFLVNIGLIIVLAPFLIGIAEKLNYSHLGRDIVYIGALFFVSALCLGLDAGSSARHRAYEGRRMGVAMCGRYATVRKIGDLYLAVLPSSRKALIDNDCKIKFRFPLTRIDR